MFNFIIIRKLGISVTKLTDQNWRNLNQFRPKWIMQKSQSSQSANLSSEQGIFYQKALTLSSNVERDLISVDPFTTLPMKLNRSEQALVHFSKRLFLELAPKWTSAIFSESIGLKLSLTHEAMFCNLLSVTSAYLDTVTGRGPTPETFKWSMIGIRRINNLLSDSATRVGDEVLMTLPQILISDSMAMGGESCKIHSRGLAELIKYRGGFESTGRPDAIESWICIISVVSSKAQTAYLGDIQPGDRRVVEAQDWQIEKDHLFSNLETLTTWISEKYLDSPPSDMDDNDPLEVFGTKLHEPQDEYEDSYQMFLLGYLALALWDHRDSVEDTLSVLCEFTFQCKQLRSHYPLPDVSYILIRGLDHSRARKWAVLRMIKALHRLSPALRLKTKYLLFHIVDLVSRERQVLLAGINQNRPCRRSDGLVDLVRVVMHEIVGF